MPIRHNQPNTPPNTHYIPPEQVARKIEASALLVGLLFGSLAVTLGIAGWEAVADNEATNRKSAIAAVVLGVVAIVISLVALVFRIWLIV